jgi:hypothetical protein
MKPHANPDQEPMPGGIRLDARRLLRCVLLGGLAAGLIGCSQKGKTYPVKGQVVYEDGTPVTGGVVEFLTKPPEGKAINARGVIDEQGKFVLSTFAPGDGAVIGEHQAIVVGPRELPTGDPLKASRPKSVDAALGDYQTSGLTFSVKPEKNYFVIKVRREK